MMTSSSAAGGIPPVSGAQPTTHPLPEILTNRPGVVYNGDYSQEILEADQSNSETSSFKDDDGSCSITASIIEYEYENGRRYHAYKAGHYPIPNDEKEQDRLDLQHHVFKLLLRGELHLAPLDPQTMHRALDLGTGTGLWAIEFADLFPDALVTGIDLSPVQPLWVPDNLRFEIDDVESEWMRPENHFDYIHSRVMVGAIDNWARMTRRAYKHLRPGGWIEFQDLDSTLTSDDGTHEKSVWHRDFLGHLVAGANKYGKHIPAVTDYERWMVAAGFVDVKTVVFKLPLNAWPKDKHLKEVGKYQFHNYHDGYEAISIGFFTRALGWTSTEFQVLLARVRSELRDRSIHAYMQFVVCIGRKPYPHEVSHRTNSSRASTAESESHAAPFPSTNGAPTPPDRPEDMTRGIPIQSLLS